MKTSIHQLNQEDEVLMSKMQKENTYWNSLQLRLAFKEGYENYMKGYHRVNPYHEKMEKRLFEAFKKGYEEAKEIVSYE